MRNRLLMYVAVQCSEKSGGKIEKSLASQFSVGFENAHTRLVVFQHSFRPKFWVDCRTKITQNSKKNYFLDEFPLILDQDGQADL